MIASTYYASALTAASIFALSAYAAMANQELFIFKKGDDAQWRIARYSFSPTNPPAK